MPFINSFVICLSFFGTSPLFTAACKRLSRRSLCPATTLCWPLFCLWDGVISRANLYKKVTAVTDCLFVSPPLCPYTCLSGRPISSQSVSARAGSWLKGCHFRTKLESKSENALPTLPIHYLHVSVYAHLFCTNYKILLILPMVNWKANTPLYV